MDVVEDPACLNCGRPLTGRFCAECGQKRASVDLTLRELVHETTHELTHWDGKIPSTIKALFLKPGLLTVDYFEGRRARWLSPLRLYLLCSVAYFLSGPMVEAITDRRGDELAEITISNQDGTRALTPDVRRELEASRAARIFGVDRLERAAMNPARLNDELRAVLPKAMFLLLPIFALLTRVAWKRRLPRYPAHLYLALHLHAAWFGAFAVLTIVAEPVESPIFAGVATLAAFVYVTWYGLVATRRVFRDSWPLTIAKSAGVFALYSVCLLVVVLLLLAYAVMRM